MAYAAAVASIGVAAHVIWNDPLPVRMLLGLALIGAGVLLVDLG